MINKLLYFIVILFFFDARAGLLIGSGFNSATGGRLVPSLNLGVGSDSFEVLFTSTGVSTPAYYHSAYKLGAYWTWKAGDFLVGNIDAGFGGGALYAIRSFADTGAQADTKTDYVLGPTFFARWNFWEPVFIGVDGLYGLIGPSGKNGDVLVLNARDNVSFVLGVRW